MGSPTLENIQMSTRLKRSADCVAASSAYGGTPSSLRLASGLFRRALVTTGVGVLALALGGCSGKFLKVENPEVLRPDAEFDRAVKIVVPPSSEEAAEAGKPNEGVTVSSVEPAKTPEPKKPSKAAPKKKPAKGAKKSAATEPPRHEPDLEDGEGFVGRRPVVDPFRVGETVVHDVHYMGISGGTLTLKVDPFGEVNGRKVYNFVTRIETYPTFSSLVYALDDRVVTLVDFDQLIPHVFTLHVKESGQLREARAFFDFEKNEATYWEKKVTKKNGVEEKKQQWEILPFSQNVYSAIFYMRLFKWEDGKEYAFRVAHDGENLVFRGKVVAREVLDTELGPMKAIKVKPEITVKGVFKPMGDIFIWLSDDDRKLVLRIEAKIKIGTMVSEIIKLTP